MEQGGRLTRREALGGGIAGAAALTGLGWAKGLSAAIAAGPRCGRLQDIEHVVFLVQENRSFDHYFGTYKGVRGFADPNALPGVFAQPGYNAPGFGGVLLPFHLDSNASGECTHDLTHAWGPQHRSWNGGAMNGFVREHVADEGVQNGPLTMGYYKRSDLEFYYALADAFTICDAYHCSVIGPSDPNHVHIFAATLDPDGRYGGPVLETVTRTPDQLGKLSIPTMPERLRDHGITWKVYSAPDDADPEGDSPLPLFRQYLTDPQLFRNGLAPTFPLDFQRDVASGSLPQVSWIYAPIVLSEHPPLPPLWGEHVADLVLRTLTSNPAVWSKTALFITWDENGGFFDHVPPPTAPAGTPGEYVTVPNLPTAAEGIRGPVGLGFRVPLLIVSPFSRGGFVSSDTFDHTSLLRFVETRFGVEVPNLSAWRRSVTGDLTSAFNFAKPSASVPPLPATSLADPRIVTGGCATNGPTKLLEPTGQDVTLTPYQIPPNSMPGQEGGTARRPSGLHCGPRTRRRG
jgi:phospholipase C